MGNPTDVGHRATFAGAGSPSQELLVTLTAPTDLVNSNGDRFRFWP